MMSQNSDKSSDKLTKISAIVLAAGRGTRMNSPLPKVLHPVAGVPMIIRTLQACKSAGTSDLRVVVGYGQNLVRSIVEPFGAQCFQQVEQLGTADAVNAAQVETLEGTVMILNGDHPLIKSEDLTGFLSEFQNSKADIAVVTATLKKPGEFGRIIRYHGELHSIVEAKDASSDTLKIREVNTGLYLAKAQALIDLLPKIQNKNSKKEFYLTDIIEIGKEEGYIIKTLKGHSRVSCGVNNQIELAQASKIIFNRKIKDLMEAGVVVLDPTHTYIEDTVQIDQATVIYPGAYIRGNSKLGKYSVIEPNCFINDF
jgi:bifunctional UDP-N-acetylglucosamine pyrophosphorylase/glucosamine-1-phosphate N-acetyltransferase